jgi:hypothetical protein
LTQRLLADIRSLANAAASLPCQSMTAIAAKLILPSRHTEYTCNQKHMTYQKKKKKKRPNQIGTTPIIQNGKAGMKV